MKDYAVLGRYWNKLLIHLSNWFAITASYYISFITAIIFPHLQFNSYLLFKLAHTLCLIYYKLNKLKVTSNYTLKSEFSSPGRRSERIQACVASRVDRVARAVVHSAADRKMLDNVSCRIGSSLRLVGTWGNQLDPVQTDQFDAADKGTVVRLAWQGTCTLFYARNAPKRRRG